MVLASAIAFRLFLWLVPFSLVLAGAFAGLARGHGDDVRAAAKAAGVTGATRQEVLQALESGHRSWWIAVLIGAALYLWATRTLMRSLAAVSARVWGATRHKRGQREVLVWTVVYAVVWVAVVVIAGTVVTFEDVKPGGLLLSIAFRGVVLSALWLLICDRLPDSRRRRSDLVPGCLIIGFGVALLHAASRVYLPDRLEHSSTLYGSLGTATVILAWLLLVGQVIVGATIVNCMRVRRSGGVVE
jgi:uncharacterized BrkB/YihY/UPF0761 family membrane protein